MSDLGEFSSGPLFIMGGEEFTPDCLTADQVAAGCDPLLGMGEAKQTSVDGMPPADLNTGRLVCHGLRERRSQECLRARLMGKSAAAQICDLEVVFSPAA